MDLQVLAAALRAAADVLDRPTVATGVATGNGQQIAPAQQYVAPTVQQPVQQPVQQQQPAPSNITAEAITSLIQPHVANPLIKEALGVAMRAMGINALPEAQPHQYGALYQAFQAVIGHHTQAQQQPQPNPGLSII